MKPTTIHSKEESQTSSTSAQSRLQPHFQAHRWYTQYMIQHGGPLERAMKDYQCRLSELLSSRSGLSEALKLASPQSSKTCVLGHSWETDGGIYHTSKEEITQRILAGELISRCSQLSRHDYPVYEFKRNERDLVIHFCTAPENRNANVGDS